MDANRFDTLAKALTGTRSRRSAIGSVVASGVLGALGLGRGETAPVAAQGVGLCVVDFLAVVRQGPSATRSLAPGGSPGTLRGYLRYSLSESGNLEGADLLLSDGTSLPVVGQATGFGFQARIDLGQGQALVAVGVGEQEVTRCLGRLDGTTTSTEIGDLGEWHAVAGVQNAPSGTGQAGGGGNRPASGSNGSSGSGGSGNRPASGTSGTGSGSSGSSSATDQQSTGNRSNNGSSSSEDDANSEIALACPPGQTRCDGVCVDLRTDAVNCGECGLPCASELGAGSCINGICGCLEGSTRCNGICVVTDRDPLNCGRCGNACPSGQNCFNGTCTNGVQPCREGEERCGDLCFDIANDSRNCGRCGNGCSGERECRNGSCVGDDTACAEGETRCSGACVNTTSDVFNCGACGQICELDEECLGGQCLTLTDDVDVEQVACPDGQTQCSDTCTDLQTDEANCGTCGATCAAGEECVAGNCAPPAPVLCPEGQIRCDGACKEGLPNFGSQGLSCPGGGVAPTECPAGRVLCNGACFPEGTCQPAECEPGWGYCYGLCRDFQNDPGYCGGCTTGCTGGAYCQGGQCIYCSDGQTPCGNTCVDTRTDLDNCGSCGARCGTQCIDGRCTGVGPSPTEPVCQAPQTACSGVCVYMQEDDDNCGTCGNLCRPPLSCSEGRCVNSDASCPPRHSACITKCADTSVDPEHCGGCFSKCRPGEVCRDSNCVAAPALAGEQTLAPAEAETVAADELQPDGTEPDQELVTSCPEGQIDCGGVCSDIAFDEYNCGSCGFVCGSDSICERSVCVQNAPPPAAPEEEVVTESVAEEVIEEPTLEEVAPTCVDIGGACDPASPGDCCSGVCNEDGTCG